MFEHFTLSFADLSEARLRFRIGGEGPPLLLLHGHPRTHTTWHRVAPILARHFRVVCPDLRGFGQSSQPLDSPSHEGSSKRAKALDCVELMEHLGFPRFALTGHDRGAYTAFRCAMDHPDVVTRLAIIDAIPILEALERTNERFAKAWWHWFFFGVPEKPELAINASPEHWYVHDRARMGPENHEDFLAAINDPNVVHGMIEDYRAGLCIDRQHDAEDRAAGRKVRCPMLFLWSTGDDLGDLYDDPLAIWRAWADDVTGHGLASSHHVAEEAPEELASSLGRFFAGGENDGGGRQRYFTQDG